MRREVDVSVTGGEIVVALGQTTQNFLDGKLSSYAEDTSERTYPIHLPRRISTYIHSNDLHEQHSITQSPASKPRSRRSKTFN